jgi:hypothetical protein
MSEPLIVHGDVFIARWFSEHFQAAHLSVLREVPHPLTPVVDHVIGPSLDLGTNLPSCNIRESHENYLGGRRRTRRTSMGR